MTHGAHRPPIHDDAHTSLPETRELPGPDARLSGGAQERFTWGTAVIAVLAALLAIPVARAQEVRFPGGSGSTSGSTKWERAGPLTSRGPVCPRFDPSDPGSGALFWNSATGPAPLPLLAMDVAIDVSGIMVHGTVTQTFRSTAPQTIEAIYVFPLPENAAVHHMEMRIGERRIVSTVREREEARQVYAQATQEGRKAALVEQQRPNLFRTSASNINPGESVLVVLEYDQEIAYDDGVFGLHFPLTFTPRFAPPRTVATKDEPETAGPERAGRRTTAPATTARGGAGLAAGREGSAEQEEPDVSSTFVGAGSPSAPAARISVRLNAGFPLRDFASPSHDVATSWDGETLIVEPRGAAVPADRDFVLTWTPLLGREPRSALLTEDREDGRYALLMLIPPADEIGPPAGLPTETLFIVDVSGSMQGPSIVQARAALSAALGRLRPEDTFGIIAFNDRQRAWSDGFAPATGAFVADGRLWVESLQADGGTMICPALRLGLTMLKASGSDEGRVQRIIFFTDGAVENEEELLRSIVGELGRVRLHALGIGAAPNRHLMRRMASMGHGLSEFISDAETAPGRIDAFLTRLDRPVLTEIELHLEQAGSASGSDPVAPDEVYPPVLPDLHAGEPLFVSMRLPAGAAIGRAVLTGRTKGRDLRIEMPVGASDGTAGTSVAESAGAFAGEMAARHAGAGIGVRWARARTRSLLEGLALGADAEQVRRDVIEVALRFHLVSPYTSLVAVEETPTATSDSCSVRVANAAPPGSDFAGELPQGGTNEPLLLAVAVLLVLAGIALLSRTEDEA